MTIADRHDPSLRRGRRAFVLLAVLVAMMTAIFVATALLYLSQTEAAGTAASADAAQSRALAWSGSQVVMSELAGQRERILAGEQPIVQSQFVIYETAARSGVIRLLPFASGAIVESEAARVDFNHVDSESFARATAHMLDAATAASIMAWRDRIGRPVQSITELFDAPGVTAETLHGPLEALMSMNFTRSAGVRRADMLGDVSAAVGAQSARGLADVLTVFSVEPNVQSTGHLRINLNTPWSDRLARSIADRFGEEAAVLMKQVFESGKEFTNDAAIIKALREYQTPLAQWPEILDAFSTTSHELRFGRLDINTASRDALLSLPGVNEEQVSQIMNVRRDLSPTERATPVWPVLREILQPETFEAVADHVTTRSWTYRVRIAAGEVDAEDQDGPLLNPIVQEVIIDLAGALPRIAWMRDITLLRDAAMIAMEAGYAGDDRDFTRVLAEPEGDPLRVPQSESRSGPAGVTGRASTAPAPREAARPASRDSDTGEPAAESPSPKRIGRWRPST